MASRKPVNLEDLVEVDDIADRIGNMWHQWDMLRAKKVQEWREIQEYIFATDTNTTSNSVLPWSNKTTIPKLCQIRDNLFSNYMAALFPQRKWLVWEGDREADETATKQQTITSYMSWVIDRNEFYSEVKKMVLDYIDYGNVFAIPEWMDMTNENKEGYQGPLGRRISPLDIVFDPTAANFNQSIKIIRSIVSLGEVKDIINSGNVESPDDLEANDKLYKEILENRNTVFTSQASVQVKDHLMSIAGFGDYKLYMGSNVAEVLTFYGDYFDVHTQTYYRNKIIKIVDRCKLLGIWDAPSFFGQPTIYHVGWRVRPDNLWAMGPLDNLVGMQYRIDHLENMKSDVFDIIAYPPIVIKGEVQDFKWAPMEKIYVGDDGAVNMLVPDVMALQADTQIAILENKMEEMAGSPKEAMGFRTPGEKTMYEVQQLQMAAGRIFQNKTAAFERDFFEPLLNAMLELARRKMTSSVIRVFDSDEKIAVFQTLSVQDITGTGRIKPIAARHFAEKANQVQNLTNFFASAAGQNPAVTVHFSGLQLAQMWENLLEIEDWNLVQPYVALVEQSEAQQFQASAQQNMAQSVATPSGIGLGNDDQVPEEGEPTV